jgi:hypothetical protein
VQLADVVQGIGGFVIDGEELGDEAGLAVSLAGDVNGDGLADIVVGTHRADPVSLGIGRSYVVFGKADTDVVSLSDVAVGAGGFVLTGEDTDDGCGWSVSGGGDVNGDGLADVIVGALYADHSDLEDAGRTYVVFGKTDTQEVSLVDVAGGLGGFVLDGDMDHDAAGWPVSDVGDVDGDGLADIIVGAHLAGPNGPDSGRAYLVFGKADTQAVLLVDVAAGLGGFVLDGEAEGDEAGRSVSGAGDVNGDGIPDVIVGTDGADPNGEDSGRAYVVFGKASTAPVQLADVSQGTGGFVLDGEGVGHQAGRSVSGAGDVNGDGLADVIVGAASASPNGLSSGRAYVVFGRADTGAVSLADVAAGVGGFALDGEAEADHAGRAVSGAGDINGDGLADVVVGAYGADPNGLDVSGRTYVVFGKADTELVSLADVALGVGGFAIDGEDENDSSGAELAGSGDINGDGIPDIVVGAPYASLPNMLYRAGRTYVVFGGDFSCEGR